MSHGRVLYRCGCLRSQCRCPGPHVDTVLPIACPKHAQAAPPDVWRDLIIAVDRERLLPEVWD